MQTTAERVHSELERVLARGEFQRQRSLLEELLDRLPGLDAEQVTLIGEILRWTLVALLSIAVALLAVRLARSWIAARGAPADGARVSGSDPEARVAELLARARAARAGGDLRLALRLYLMALLQAFGGSGDLEYRPAWTHRELLRRGRPSPAARALLEALVGELEAKEFGRAGVEPSDLDRLEALLGQHGQVVAGGGA